MSAEEIRAYCLSKKGVEESFPFGEETLVFKVGNKLFCLLSLDAQPTQVNLKCEPDFAIELRENYSYIRPGYHMNKTHWNTVVCESNVKARLIYQLIDHSYERVVFALPKKIKTQFNL